MHNMFNRVRKKTDNSEREVQMYNFHQKLFEYTNKSEPSRSLGGPKLQMRCFLNRILKETNQSGVV